MLPSLPSLSVAHEIVGDSPPARAASGSRPMGSAALRAVPSPAPRRGATTRSCARRRGRLGRMVLVNRLEETAVVDGSPYDLSTSFFPGAVHPEGYRAIVASGSTRGRRGSACGQRAHRALAVHAARAADDDRDLAARRIRGRLGRARLFVRPMISGRDYHALHLENDALVRDVTIAEGLVTMRPYEGVPAVYLHHNGLFRARPDWYRRFEYPVERERGLDHRRICSRRASCSSISVPDVDAVAVFSARAAGAVGGAGRRAAARRAAPTKSWCGAARSSAPARPTSSGSCASPPTSSSARRDEHRTVVAGYPWFTDWGRDTFIALPGLALATGWTALASELLLAWARCVRDGLIPNRFPDAGRPSTRRSTRRCGSCWRRAASPIRRPTARRSYTFCRRCAPSSTATSTARARHRRRRRRPRARGRAGAGADVDGRARRRWCVTPRAGKPVEMQALWVAALEAVAHLLATDDPDYSRELPSAPRWARSSFAAASGTTSTAGSTTSSTDQDARQHAAPEPTVRARSVRAARRPERAERVLAVCERELVTPVGLRTRAPATATAARFTGDERARDAAYHEGTVWPFLLGIYADACKRVRGRVPRRAPRRAARARRRRRARAACRDLRRRSAAPAARLPGAGVERRRSVAGGEE